MLNRSIQLTFYIALFLMCSCNSNSTTDKVDFANESSGIPIPTQVYDRMDNESEFESKKEAWLELIHQSAPGVDWKAVNQSNFEAYEQQHPATLSKHGNLQQLHRTPLHLRYATPIFTSNSNFYHQTDFHHYRKTSHPFKPAIFK